jgi:L-ribulose-5-phosphate 3-epimerase
MYKKIGFMQGRLSPIVNGKIQAFPWNHWKDEFCLAQSIKMKKMEWTLDQENLYESPLLTKSGQSEIRALMKQYGVHIPSVTGDCFMQVPFFKRTDSNRKELLKDFENIVIACSALNIGMIVLPLVDNSSITTQKEKKSLIDGLKLVEPTLKRTGTVIIFESDFPPKQLAEFISEFSTELYGINYDCGNSASLGFDPHEEIETYGDRILNVHVKDRHFCGSTVALGEGNTDFITVFSELSKVGYQGNFILQAARANDHNHKGVLEQYRNYVNSILEKVKYGS